MTLRSPDSYTHNYYVDFLKAFNIFIQKVFNKNIKKIEYSIGSKTLLTHNLYKNESFNYPNAIIDLQDFRVAEGVSTISRNAYGFIPSMESAVISDNDNKNEIIYAETQRYLLNLNIQVNVETNSDLLNLYHIVSNNIPINFTFVDFIYYYFIDVTEMVKEWDFDNDDIYNIIKAPDETERDNEKYFSLLSVQPQLELQSINKTEDKENNKFSINFSFLVATQIPTKVYSSSLMKINRIIIDTNIDQGNSFPILMDIDLNKYKSVKKGIILLRKDFEEKDNEYIIQVDKIDGLTSLYFNPNILLFEKDITYIPLDSDNINITNSDNKTIISIKNSEYDIIKNYFENEDNINEDNELIQLFIS